MATRDPLYFPDDIHKCDLRLMASYPQPQTSALAGSSTAMAAEATQHFPSLGFVTLHEPSHMAVDISGYLHSHGRARDHYKGRYLEDALLSKSIDLEAPPPFSAATQEAGYPKHGVVKISNIPFTVNAQEIIQFVNRYAPFPMLKKNVEGYPIHVVMEKPTGKTMDCFVEFSTQAAAQACVGRFEDVSNPGRGMKLGTRNVGLDLSNQAELLEAIFPRARLVNFDKDSGEPTVLTNDGQSSWSEGFRGYFTLEEIYGVMRFAENPSRSPFVLKCHQRVYECMVSTLYKFPWAAIETYTVASRDALFEAAHKQLSILSKKVGTPTVQGATVSLQWYDHNNNNPYRDNKRVLGGDAFHGHMNNREVGLGQALLFDLLFAALNVPAFTLLQKSALCHAVGSYGRGISLGDFSQAWPFQSLVPAHNVSDHIVKFWLELFDTGFTIMTNEEAPTYYEHLIVFNRNSIGFPIGEWTAEGAKLRFNAAIEVETAVMMQYVICGRMYWARERHIDINEAWSKSMFPHTDDRDYLQMLDHEHNADDGISPKSSGAWTLLDPDLNRANADTNAGMHERAYFMPTSYPSRFNPVSATEFAPSSKSTSASISVATREANLSSPTCLRMNDRAQVINDDPKTRFKNPFRPASSTPAALRQNLTISTAGSGRDTLGSSAPSPTTILIPSSGTRLTSSGADSPSSHLLTNPVHGLANSLQNLSMTTAVTKKNHKDGRLVGRSYSASVTRSHSAVEEPQAGSDHSSLSDELLRSSDILPDHQDPFVSPKRTQTLPNLATSLGLRFVDRCDSANQKYSIRDFGVIGSARSSIAGPAGARVNEEIEKLRTQSIPTAFNTRNISSRHGI